MITVKRDIFKKVFGIPVCFEPFMFISEFSSSFYWPLIYRDSSADEFKTVKSARPSPASYVNQPVFIG